MLDILLTIPTDRNTALVMAHGIAGAFLVPVPVSLI